MIFPYIDEDDVDNGNDDDDDDDELMMMPLLELGSTCSILASSCKTAFMMRMQMMVISVAIKSGSRVFDQGRRILAKFIAPQKGPFYPHISLCGVFSQLDFQQN